MHSHILRWDFIFLSLKNWVQHHSVDQRLAPFQMSADGWIEELLKLGYEKEKHFKQSHSTWFPENDSSRQTSKKAQQSKIVSYSKQRWHRANKGKRLICRHTGHRGSVWTLRCIGLGTTLSTCRDWCHMCVWRLTIDGIFCYHTSITYLNVGIILKEGNI